MQLFTAQDGDRGDVKAEDLFKTLKDDGKDMNPAVVRLKDDLEYFAFIKEANKHIQTAQGMAQMVAGAVVPVWQVAGIFCDGPGWRVLLNWQQIQAQIQAAPAGLGLNGKGLRGLKG